MENDPVQIPPPSPEPPQPGAPSPAPRGTVGQAIAWIVIIITAAGLFALPYLAPRQLPATIVNPTAASSFQLKLAARYAVGIKAFAGGEGGAMLSGAVEQLSTVLQ